MQLCSLTGLLLLALLGGVPREARATDTVEASAGTEAVAAPVSQGGRIGLTVGPSVGGGSLAGGVVQLQLSRPLFLEADIGYRGGWVIGRAYYPNFVLAGGLAMQFGGRPWRNGFFVKAASTLPASFHEVWVAFGWSARIWGPQDLRSFTLDLGPAVYLVRHLPPNTDLDEIPFFIHLRAAWHFPIVTRAGNTSDRTLRGRKARKAAEAAAAGEAETQPEPEAP